MPSLAPVMTANRPSSRKEGSSSITGSNAIAIALPCPPSCSVKRMEIVHESFVERIRRVDIDAIGCDNVVVLQPNAADAGLARVGLKIERHPFLEYDGRILGRRTEEWSFPRIDA